MINDPEVVSGGIAGADLSAAAGTVLTEHTTIGQYVLATDDDATLPPAGFCKDGDTSGNPISIQRGGLMEVKTGAAITHGTHKELTHDASGRVVPADAAGEWVVAHAELRSNAGGADEWVWVRVVTPYRYTLDTP